MFSKSFFVLIIVDMNLTFNMEIIFGEYLKTVSKFKTLGSEKLPSQGTLK